MPTFASFIDAKQLKEAMRSKCFQDRVVAMIVDTDKDTLSIMSMSGQIGQPIPLKDVDNPNVPYRPDYTDVEIVDYGFGLRFGHFEVCADWALWKAGIKQ